LKNRNTYLDMAINGHGNGFFGIKTEDIVLTFFLVGSTSSSTQETGWRLGSGRGRGGVESLGVGGLEPVLAMADSPSEKAMPPATVTPGGSILRMA